MRLLAVLLFVIGVTYGAIAPERTTAFEYLTKIGIPEAERIRNAEEQFLNDTSRIVGGQPTAIGQYPFQAGLIIDLIGTTSQAVCGATLISNQILVTAGHCWFDGTNQAWRFTVVLGSTLLFSQGKRVTTTDVIPHPEWTPSLIRNDVAIIRLFEPVLLSEIIFPISLPTGSEVNENFALTTVTVSGFGIKSDSFNGIGPDQYLSHVNVQSISNLRCNLSFLGIVQPTNICTSGDGGRGPCGGDSGGPLFLVRENRYILAGLVIELVGIDGVGVCGASLITDNHLVTAAHCWFDGQNQASRFTVVLGSVTLFTGGTRLQTTNVKTHPNWNPNIVLNDVARIVLPLARHIVYKITLWFCLKEMFADVIATASGFGKTSDNISGQFLSHVNLTVIQNYECSLSYPGLVQSTNLCTSGNSGAGPCGGDSGGPLVYKNGNDTILIGIISFGSAFGYSIGFPSAYSRVTSFLGFIQGYM